MLLFDVVFLNAPIFEQVNNNKVLRMPKSLKDLKDIEVNLHCSIVYIPAVLVDLTHISHQVDLMDMLVVLLTNRARILRKVRMDTKVKTVSKVSKVTATITMHKVNRMKVTDTVAPLTLTMARTSIDGELKRSGCSG